jgi:hypothetical protein
MRTSTTGVTAKARISSSPRPQLQQLSLVATDDVLSAQAEVNGSRQQPGLGCGLGRIRSRTGHRRAPRGARCW